MGLSGSGTSTLTHVMAGLDTADADRADEVITLTDGRIVEAERTA